MISRQRIYAVLFSGAVALAIASVAFSQTESQNNQPEEKIYSAKEVSKKVVIKDKPVPEYTLIARQHGVEGVVVLRAVFRSSGKVTNIQATKTLPDGLTDQAIDAAKRIKFNPAEKDGHPVAMFLQLEYHFSL